MALTAKHKEALALLSLPSEDEMRLQLASFQRRSGMTTVEVARAIGYAYTTLILFINGDYGKRYATDDSSRAIRAELKQFMDLHEVDNDYQIVGTHHATSAYKDVRSCMMSALAKGTAYVIDGPPGTEKTWCLRQVEREIRDSGKGRAIYVYARIGHTPQSFLQECCNSAGLPNRGTIDLLLRKLRFFLARGRTLLIVDEAQHLNHAGLEVLRQLLDLPPHFGVVLAGSHDLTQRLSHWTMEQWRSRLRRTLHLEGPSQAEARAILRDELGSHLTDQQCDETIANCKATAQRLKLVSGKNVNVNFTYTSARQLFGAIERVKEVMNSQKEGAA